jgi:predicted transposase YbfD/YdcC/uncharacterized ubiquitin-like protein YukD
MPRISKDLAEIKKIISGINEPVDVTKTPKKVIRKLIIHLKDVEDVRNQDMILYRLDEIIIMTFFATLGFCDTWQDIVFFCEEKIKFFKKFLKLKNGIPSHDTFQRVFGLIDSANFNKVIIDFILERFDTIKKVLKIQTNKENYRHLAVDGKECKGSGRLYGGTDTLRNVQILNVYDNTNEVCIYSRAIDKKTNEIPVAREILSEMNLNKTIITFDALHTQKKTIETIVARNGDYVGGLKDNQTEFYANVIEYFTEDVTKAIEKSNTYYELIEKSHSQIEIRKYYLTTDVKWFYNLSKWDKLNSFIKFEKILKKNGKETKETRYYISSLTDVLLCAEAIRGHWSIENNLHWQLDYAFREDEQTTIDKVALTNLSILKKIALAIINLNRDQFKKASVKSIRKMVGWSTEANLNILLSRLDEDVLKSLIKED